MKAPIKTISAIALVLSFFFALPTLVHAQCTCSGHECDSEIYSGHPEPDYQLQGACGNCGTLRRDCSSCAWGVWYCYNEGACSPDSTQCLGTKYQTCTQACIWQDSGTDGDSDGTDLQCGDSICDHEQMYVDATRFGSEIGACVGPECASCEDGADNDCDLTYDCSDSNCQGGSLLGQVYDQEGSAATDSLVELYTLSLEKLNQDTADASGAYSFNSLCGDYAVVASKPSYLPDTKMVRVPPLAPATKDLTIVYSQLCEADCTYVSDSLIHSSCSGINGCIFYDALAASVCANAQPGWIRDYNATHFVKCASSSPQERITKSAKVSCAKENLIKASKIVNYQGKLVRLTVATCG